MGSTRNTTAWPKSSTPPAQKVCSGKSAKNKVGRTPPQPTQNPVPEPLPPPPPWLVVGIELGKGFGHMLHIHSIMVNTIVLRDDRRNKVKIPTRLFKVCLLEKACWRLLVLGVRHIQGMALLHGGGGGR